MTKAKRQASAKIKTAGSVKVGERIETTSGMREVVGIAAASLSRDPRDWARDDGSIVLWVQDPYAVSNETPLRFKKKARVRFLPKVVAREGKS